VLRLRDTFVRFEAVFVARDALFVVLRLREALVRFEAVFVARDAVFAAVRPRALPPPTLARDLDAVIFADLSFVAGVLETVFLEVAVFFAAGRPRALIPPRDFEAVVFDDLAIQTPLSWIGSLPAPGSLIESAGSRNVRGTEKPASRGTPHATGLKSREKVRNQLKSRTDVVARLGSSQLTGRAVSFGFAFRRTMAPLAVRQGGG
jgi:hypothetical protein